ncbi:MAG: GNAT family N-acetyltransferase, partial [Clostridia bacterium]|nr:GNAT family N-acetyltransferase [Clostridia bacterium]
DKLYGAIEFSGHTIYFDGKTCKMCGAGGVVSDPNGPYKGTIKQIFIKAFEKMRETGYIFSHLYPFAENYYRQFGYDASAEYAFWNVPVERLSVPKYGKNVYFDGSDRMRADIEKVYAQFIVNQNLAVVKNKTQWKLFYKNRVPYQDRSAYVHYNDENIPDGYMDFVAIQKDGTQDLEVKTLWYTTMAGLKGCLSFFEKQKQYCNRVIIKLPKEIDISAFIDSTGGWGRKDKDSVHSLKNNGQTRVVDVEEVLKFAKIDGEGQVCIEIVGDTYAPWNNGSYTVSFGKERVVKKGGKADIQMDINAFSSAILGRYSLENLELLESVKILSNRENLKKLFYIKPIWLEDTF